MLADALNIPRFNWVGWSSGGDVGLVLAALHGHRVFKMISHAGVAGGTNTSKQTYRTQATTQPAAWLAAPAQTQHSS